MIKLFDRVKVNIPTTGTGDIEFGAAVSTAYLTPTEAGVLDGDEVRYFINDGLDFEEGIGLIKDTVATMERTVAKSKIGGVVGTSPINLSGTAVLSLTASAADIGNMKGANNGSDFTDPAAVRDNIDVLSADQSIEFYSTLALEQAEDRMSGPVTAGPDGNGFFDGFNVLDYVDVAGAVNLDTSYAGRLNPEGGTPITANGPHTMTTDLPGWDGYTIRDRYEASVIAASGSQVRLRLTGPTSGAALQVGAMYIGHAATSGLVYSFDGTQVQVKVGGAGSFTVGVGAEILTDWIDYPVDDGKPLVIAYYVTSGDVRLKAGTSADYASYNKSANDASATVAQSGYSESSAYDISTVSRIDVRDVVGLPLMVESHDLNLNEEPDWCRITAFVDPAGAGINSDVVFSASRDGSDFGQVIMQDRHTRPDGSIAVVGKVDLSNLSAGTTGRWRIETDNGFIPSILAVGIMFGVN